jgi:hypothetical protein
MSGFATLEQPKNKTKIATLQSDFLSAKNKEKRHRKGLALRQFICSQAFLCQKN